MDGTIISAGSILGDILELAAGTLAAALAAALIGVALRFMGKLGVQIKDEDRARLQELIENGIKAMAQKANIALDGRLSIDTKSQLIAMVATEYLPKFGAETITRLGGNVLDSEAMETIVAGRSADVLALPATVRAAGAGEVSVPPPLKPVSKPAARDRARRTK